MNSWEKIKTENFDTAEGFINALVGIAGEHFIFRIFTDCYHHDYNVILAKISNILKQKMMQPSRDQ
tara:strand:- start:5438 stop:5635 length:198 start_codon:yes stop_codon:yes gene_type:complete